MTSKIGAEKTPSKTGQKLPGPAWLHYLGGSLVVYLLLALVLFFLLEHQPSSFIYVSF